jgi:hypothetical protein
VETCCRVGGTIYHLVRRGAGAEDEVLGEAVPAELGVGAAAGESRDEEHGGEEPLRHSGPDGTRSPGAGGHRNGWLRPTAGAGLLLLHFQGTSRGCHFIGGTSCRSLSRTIPCYPFTVTISTYVEQRSGHHTTVDSPGNHRSHPAISTRRVK